MRRAMIVLTLLMGCTGGTQYVTEGKWRLADPPWTATMEFSDDKVGGKGPVNNWSSSYTVEENRLSFGPVITTRMAGSPAAMAAESAFLTRLGRVDNWLVEDDRLVLRAGDERLLVFVRP